MHLIPIEIPIINRNIHNVAVVGIDINEMKWKSNKIIIYWFFKQVNKRENKISGWKWAVLAEIFTQYPIIIFNSTA